jgi:hypothetical protein
MCSTSLSNLVSLASENAKRSPLQIKHGAVLFTSRNQVYQTSHNDVGHRICGFDVPSLHAEAMCLKFVHNRHRYQGRRCEKETSKV